MRAPSWRPATCRCRRISKKGFGDSPETVAETIRLAAETGLAGGSIEDATGDPERPLFDISHATERVAAAVEAARSLSFPFVLTARSENFLRGNPDLDDTIRRLQAFEKAGADVLFAPGLPDLASVRAVCAAVSKPVNFMAGIKGRSFTVAELEAAGVKRISLATSLYRAAMTGLLDAAREVKERRDVRVSGRRGDVGGVERVSALNQSGCGFGVRRLRRFGSVQRSRPLRTSSRATAPKCCRASSQPPSDPPAWPTPGSSSRDAGAVHRRHLDRDALVMRDLRACVAQSPARVEDEDRSGPGARSSKTTESERIAPAGWPGRAG